MSHTPGPWYVEGEGGVSMNGLRDAYQVVPANGPRFVLRTFNSRVPSGEQSANAMLAAAAPAMLQLLEDYYVFLSYDWHQNCDCEYCGPTGWIARIREQIAKARGEGMTQAPTPISAASTAGKGSASPRHSLGAVSGATTKAKQIRAYVAEHYPDGLKWGDGIRIATALDTTPARVSYALHYQPLPKRLKEPAAPRVYGDRRQAILDYIERVYPCGVLPHGAQTSISEVFGISRERVRQIARNGGVGQAPREGPRGRGCLDCGGPLQKHKRWCDEHATILLSCAECGGDFRESRSQLKHRLHQKGKDRVSPQFFCSHKCAGSWSGKTYGFGVHKKNANRSKTHCKYGHEFTPENTYTFLNRNGNPGRGCKACHQIRKQEATCESLPPASQTSGTNWTPSSEPAPVQAGSSGTPASTSGAQP